MFFDLRSVFYSFHVPLLLPETSHFQQWSSNSCFQGLLLASGKAVQLGLEMEWGRERETEEGVSAVRPNTLRDMLMEKKLENSLCSNMPRKQLVATVLYLRCELVLSDAVNKTFFTQRRGGNSYTIQEIQKHNKTIKR